jgi:hypothetical protein
MTIERDEADTEWPASDPVREAISGLLMAIIENTAPGSRERAAAVPGGARCSPEDRGRDGRSADA